MMLKYHFEKKLLIKKIFNHGQDILKTEAKNTIADFLELELKEKYDYDMSSRTLVRCFDNIYKGNNPQYRLKDDLAWDFLSKLLGYKNFNEFCEQNHRSDETEEDNKLLKEISETLSQIKENISLALSHFMMKKSSWGLFGLFLLAGLFFNKNGFLKKENLNASILMDTISTERIHQKTETNAVSMPQRLVYIPQVSQNKIEVEEKGISAKKEKECMFWDEDHYEEVNCDELKAGIEVVALNQEKMFLKKINSPDTLTVENSIGKIWYDKTNKRVEFFTHYGIHPRNGKTLKPVTSYIIETYAK